MHDVGPYEGLSFWLLSATSSSLEMPVHLDHGPMQAFRSVEIPLAANHVGPHNTLAGQPVVFPMGQSEPIV